jgi:hypothetical protein
VELNARQLARALSFILCANEQIPWYTGYLYTGHSMSKTDDGYLLVVRARRGNGGEAIVAMYGGWVPYDCWVGLAQDLHHRDVRWKPDKFRK